MNPQLPSPSEPLRMGACNPWPAGHGGHFGRCRPRPARATIAECPDRSTAYRLMSSGYHWIALLPPPDAEALALGWSALRWSPRVCLLDEAVLLELSACERLWGGRSVLHQLISEQKEGFRHEGWAFAATAFVALALLRCAPLRHGEMHDCSGGPPQVREGPPGGQRSTCSGKRGGGHEDSGARVNHIDQLPLHALTAARPHLAMLERAGIATWGALRKLPRDGLARRFGAPLLDALDQAYGLRPDSFAWLELPERFERTLELPALAESAPTLLFGAQRLLQPLRVWLQARQLGVLALDLRWRHDLRRLDGAVLPPWGELPIRTAQPTQDMVHLTRLLVEHLAHTPLAAPVHTLALTVHETAPFQPQAPQLLAGAGPQGLAADGAGDARPGAVALHELLERLSARLGAAQVLRLEAQADHRPEQRQHWIPAVSHAPAAPSHANAALAGTGHDILLPTWLLQVPQPLAIEGERPQYFGPLRLLAGPHRIESGWWPEAPGQGHAGCSGSRDTALRDYFVAHSPQAGLLWIYRQRLPQHSGNAWFLHGMYG